MEVKISIKDLCAEIVRKAWLLVIGMVVFAVLLGAYKYKQDFDTAKMSQQTSVKEELSEEEMAVVSEYLALKASLDGQKDYIENSIYMNIDPYHVVVTNLQFFIDTEDDSNLTSAVIGLRNYITNGSMAVGIEEQNEDLKASYVQDVFTVTGMDFSSENVSKIVNLKIYTQDQETAQAIVDAINVQIGEFSANLQETIGNHTLKLMYQEQGEVLDKTLQTTQETYIKNYNTNKDNVESAFDALSEKQKLVVEESVGEKEAIENGEEPEESVQTNETVKIRISKKFVVLGAFLGIVFMACVIVFFYLINGTIKHPEEIRNGYNFPYFGSLTLKQKNIFEKISDRLFYKKQNMSFEQEQELIISKIQIACENQNISRLILAGGMQGEKQEQFALALASALSKNQVEVIAADDLVNSSDEIRKCGKANYVVLAETLKKTSYSQIRQEIMLCQEQQKQIIGYFVME